MNEIINKMYTKKYTFFYVCVKLILTNKIFIRGMKNEKKI